MRLIVSLNEDGGVVMRRDSDVKDSAWLALTQYWLPSEPAARRRQAITVDVKLFTEKLDWLRHVWLANGYQLTVDASVTEAVKASRQEDTKFRELLEQHQTRHAGSTIEIPGLKKTLTRQQNENILHLLDMPNGANFSVPGAGKTLTTLSVWRTLVNKSQVRKMLVVAPRSAFHAWEDEQKSFVNGSSVFRYSGDLVPASAEILLVNYEQLENPRKVEHLKSWINDSKTMLVLDEAHRIKGGGASVRWRACRDLSTYAARTEILTGTPMPQGQGDVIALYSVAWPRVQQNTLASCLGAAKRGTIFVRTTKDELDLPAVDYQVIAHDPSPIQEQILDALRDRYKGMFSLGLTESENLARRGKAVMTLLAAATNPGLLKQQSFADHELGLQWPPIDAEPDGSLGELINRYLVHEHPWKFEFISKQVSANTRLGKKTLIWTSFVGNIAVLKKALGKFSPAVVYGAVDAETREAEIRRFRASDRCSVLITNPQTLGEGISLHDVCHDAIYVDRTFNAGLYLQSVDRIHRLGLSPETRTNIQILKTSNSIETAVESRLETKVRAMSAFLDDVGLVRSSLPQIDELSPGEVLGLDVEDLDEIYRTWSK